MVEMPLGSTPHLRIATIDEAPQSTSTLPPSARVRWKQVLNRPPLPKASPEPRNWRRMLALRNLCHPERSEGSMEQQHRSLAPLGMTRMETERRRATDGSRRLLQARHLVGEGRAVQVADLGVVVAAGTVHGDAVVPHDDVVRPPDMG